MTTNSEEIAAELAKATDIAHDNLDHATRDELDARVTKLEREREKMVSGVGERSGGKLSKGKSDVGGLATQGQGQPILSPL